MLKDEKVEIADIFCKNKNNTNVKVQEHNGLENCDFNEKTENSDNDDKISDNDDKFVVKSRRIISCDFCDYKTYRQSDFYKHILTRKHKNNDNSDKNDDKLSLKVVNTFMCKCGKVYKYRQGLCYHKKHCKQLTQDKDKDKDNDNYNDQDKTELMILTELVKNVIKQNQDLTNKIVDICKVGGNNISNNNVHSNNKTFNLHFFLNETCKNAMNISEFVESIKFQIKDLEYIGEVGFVDGISEVVLNNLTELDSRERPIHCCDNKREILYIKDNNEWVKDDELNTKMSKVIKQIAHKNMKIIPEWIKNNPNCHKSHSKYNDKYLKIVSNSMSGGTELEQKTNINKIIKKVAKKVIIDKNKYQVKII
jgi:hypothetical protein